MKKIGITSSIIESEGRYYIGQDRYYFDAIERLGARAYLLPRILDLDKIQALINELDGIIFTGGTHVNPINYGQENTLKNYEYDNERDFFEINLARMAYESKLPILGICRGHQLLNVAFGGSLYQDILKLDDKSVHHYDKKDPFKLQHEVKVDKNSFIYELFGSKDIKVNSIHSQAIDNMADIFKVTAKSKDNIIEAMEYKNKDAFIKSYQFHPEKLIDDDEKFLQLIGDFVSSCPEKLKDLDSYKEVRLEEIIHENMVHYLLDQEEFNSYQDREDKVLFLK